MARARCPRRTSRRHSANTTSTATSRTRGWFEAGKETSDMTIEVKVPDIGDFSDVPVIGILVSVGDTIAAEDPILELESDKATMEVPAPAAGTVKEIKVSEGDTVSEGSLVMILEGSDAGAGDAPEAETKSESKPAPAAEEAPAPASAPTPAPAAVTDAGFGKVHASPSVRAFARQLEIDLNKVNGTGRKGRILREDVTAHLKSTSAPAAGGAPAQGGMGIPPIPAVDFSKFGPVEDVEMPRIKKLSGPALHRSWLNIPHVTHNEEADITDLDAYRREMDAQAKQDGYRVTLLSFVIKASVSALKQHWEVNSSIHPDGDKLIKKDFYNIGFAADTPNGLVVPVIRDADRKGIIEVSKELGELSAKAREGKLKGDDMSGATFTISSLGGIGGTSFTPIVNAPEVAILGLTRSKMAPVWDANAGKKGKFVPRNMQPLSLSYDHRAIDGALAARFCATLKHLLGDVRRLML
ncbi:dihydrolipoyllysine-residue acetyltransferase [Cribrihabitans marinus]|uniref:dihydrolipoyllysine-residue acetyltransferase n=1 Tax=Cribrihabitans marinus TaxID=1227549 RepID=UPI000B86B160|nr:dihydrolipoyllysine-residue acetyltransferase [Cribrihabitans marinus]